jgi:hypothetical protein
MTRITKRCTGKHGGSYVFPRTEEGWDLKIYIASILVC